MADGVQEFPDDTRMALAMLQQPFPQELLALWSEDSNVYHLAQHLQGKTTITAPLGYTVSDKAEDAAAEGN